MKIQETATEEGEQAAAFAVEEAERDTFIDEDMEDFLVGTLKMEPVSARAHFKQRSVLSFDWVPTGPRETLDGMVGSDDVQDIGNYDRS